MLISVEKQGFQDGDRIEVLALDGLEHGSVDGQCVCVQIGPAAKNHFAEKNLMPERLLGLIVGGGHAVDFEESEKAVVIARGIEEAQAEFFGLHIWQGVRTDGMVRIPAKSATHSDFISDSHSDSYRTPSERSDAGW